MEQGSGRIDIRGVVKRFGEAEVLREVTLDVAAHETVALLGPSGCGKTTLLRTIAGLERIDDGEITIGDELASSSSTHVRPEERRIGMVFQDWALFPHLTVGENVAYGLDRDQRRSGRVTEALELVGLATLADRLPATLSGGQQQRVALARALAPRPQAILLDEPFSNLDTSLRVQVRTEVHRLLTELGITTVFVTHDQEEAFVLGDRVAVMNAGRIEQYASPAQIYDHPASRWVAEFVGEANLVRATANGDRADSLLGTLALRDRLDGPVEVLLRPEHLILTVAEDPGSHPSGDTTVMGQTVTGQGAPGVGTVELVEYYGHDHVTIVLLDDGGRLRSRAPGAPPLARGQRVAVASNATAAVAYPRDDR